MKDKDNHYNYALDEDEETDISFQGFNSPLKKSFIQTPPTKAGSLA